MADLQEGVEWRVQFGDWNRLAGANEMETPQDEEADPAIPPPLPLGNQKSAFFVKLRSS